jgi:hypothetical protein
LAFPATLESAKEAVFAVGGVLFCWGVF